MLEVVVMETTLTTCMVSEYKTYDNRYYLNGYGGSYIMGNTNGQGRDIPSPPILG